MRIIADLQKCCSSGMCAAIAPTIFAQRESDGLVELLATTPPASELASVRRAIAGCPVRALELEE